MWDLPRPGLKPMSPSLAGGFLTTASPGKSRMLWFFKNSFFSLSFNLNNFYWPVFKFVITCVKFTNESVKIVLCLCYCGFYFQYCHLILSYSFYSFVEITPVIIHGVFISTWALNMLISYFKFLSDNSNIYTISESDSVASFVSWWLVAFSLSASKLFYWKPDI